MNKLTLDSKDAAFYSVFFNEDIYQINAAYRKETKSPDLVSEPAANSYSKASSTKPKRLKSLFLFNYPSSEGLSERDNALLNNILKGMENYRYKHNIPDRENPKTAAEAEIINCATISDLDWNDLLQRSQAKIIIAFDVPDRILPESFEVDELLEVNGRMLFRVPSLIEIESNNSRKQIFWNGLKQLYNL